MSFSDVGRRSSFAAAAGQGSREAEPADVPSSLTTIGDTLHQFQQNIVLLERLATALAQDPDPEDESLRQVAAQQDVVDDLAATLRKSFAELPRRIEDLPRKEQARPKAALSKLRKDFDRVGVDLRKVIEKIKASRRAALKKSKAAASSSSANKTNGASSSSSVSQVTSGKGDLPHRVGKAQFGPSDAPGDLDVVVGDQRIQLQVAMEEEAINDAILREREEEITTINQDVHKVNEIFKDLASLVDKQQTEVDQIGDLVEKSHAHAEKGLDQVQKAAKMQPSCAIS